MTTPQNQSCSSLAYSPHSSGSNPSGFACPPCPSLKCLPLNGISTVASPADYTNTLMNATTYTRVTVEDLFTSNKESLKHILPRPSTRSQLNPNANPFQPAYQRTQHSQTTHRSCQPLITVSQTIGNANMKMMVNSCGSAENDAEIVQTTLLNRNTTTNVFVSRGTMYFGEPTSASFHKDEDKTTLVEFDQLEDLCTEIKANNFERTAEAPAPLPKRDIAKMMWEAADLYDNALQVIRNRRVHYGKLKQKLKTITKDDNSDISKIHNETSASAAVKDVIAYPERRSIYSERFPTDHIRQSCIYFINNPYSNVFLNRPSTSDVLPSTAKLQTDMNDEPSTYSNLLTSRICENGDIDLEQTEKFKLSCNPIRCIEYTFQKSVFTLDEITGVFIGIDRDIHKDESSSLRFSKKAVMSLVEEIHRYIAELLQLDTVELVRVWLQSSDSLACLILEARDGKPINGERFEELSQESRYKVWKTEKKLISHSCSSLKSNILTCEYKEMKMAAIFEVIARIIQDVYGSKPSFRYSSAGVIEFIIHRKEQPRALEANKCDSIDMIDSAFVDSVENGSSTCVKTEKSIVRYPNENVQLKLKKNKRSRTGHVIKPVFIRRIFLKSSKLKGRKVKLKRAALRFECGMLSARYSKYRRSSVGKPKTDNVGCLHEFNVDESMMDADRVESKPTSSCFDVASNNEISPVQSNDDDENLPLTELELEWDRVSKCKDEITAADRTSVVLNSISKSLFNSRVTHRSIMESCLVNNRGNGKFCGRLRRTLMSTKGICISPRKPSRTSHNDSFVGYKPLTKDAISIKKRLSQAVDYSTVRGRMMAAPTNIIIRTIAKKSKKRTKKGWRKSWI